MSDDILDGISEGGDDLRQDKDVEGITGGVQEMEKVSQDIISRIEGLDVRPEEDDRDITQEITGGLPDQPLIDPEKVILEQQLARLTQITEQQSVFQQQRILLEEQRVKAIKSETTSAGSDEAAEVALGPFRKDFDVYYDIESGAGSLEIEVSLDSNSWRFFDSVSLPVGGEVDIAQGKTAYRFVRAFVTDGVADSDIERVELVAKGR